MKFPDHITIDTSAMLNGWKDLTINVRYTRPVKFRIWLALKLIRAAGWLVGGKVREEEGDS